MTPARGQGDRFRTAGSSGIALPLTLLLLLVLTALAHGLLRLGVAERVVAAAAVRAGAVRLQLRSLLEIELADAIRGGVLARSSSSIGLPAGAGWGLDSVGVEVVPAGRELHLVRVEPRPSRGRPGGRPAVEGLAWRLDPVARVEAIGATVEAGTRVDAPTGAVDAFSYRPAPGEWVACSAFAGSLDSLAVSRPRPPPFREDLSAAPGRAWLPLRVGALPVDTLLARLTPLAGPSSVTPRPVVDAGGACVDAPENWGDPSSTGVACRERSVAAWTPGPLEIDGGVGQGVLLVSGDLAVGGGARFSGLLLVAGDVVVSDSARVRGAVRVGGSLRVEGGSRVEGAACPVILALDRADLASPVRLDPPFILHP